MLSKLALCAIALVAAVLPASASVAATAVDLRQKFPAFWPDTTEVEEWQCEAMTICEDFDEYMANNRPKYSVPQFVAPPKAYGTWQASEPPRDMPLRVVDRPAQRGPVEVRRRIDCELICHHVVTYSDGHVEIIPEHKIHPKVAMIRNAMTQVAVKAVAVASGPFAPLTSTGMCALLNSDFDTNTASDVGTNIFGCSPFGFVYHQQYANSDAERTFMIVTGVVNLAGLGGVPLPGMMYDANNYILAGGQLIDWKSLNKKKHKPYR